MRVPGHVSAPQCFAPLSINSQQGLLPMASGFLSVQGFRERGAPEKEEELLQGRR